ncbi:MAG: hypothetical protein QNK05_16775 [Myxococcota bacterium]|nr:hypothetical protein [Myxococcota bacterium]
MRRAHRGALLLLILALGGALPAVADRSIEVYRAQMRTADELLPLAQTALAGEGTATLDPGSNAILLVGPEARVAEALALLRELDARRKSVVIHFESRRRDELSKSGIEVDWGIEAGPLRVGTVIVPSDAKGARVTTSLLAGERAGGFSATVRVLDGEVGRIGSGASVPVRSRFEIERVEAQRGILARPRVLSDGRVQVELAPDEGQVDAAGRVRFVSGATTVTVRPGDTTVVGGLERRSDVRTSGTRVLSSDSASEERLWLLRVELPE